MGYSGLGLIWRNSLIVRLWWRNRRASRRIEWVRRGRPRAPASASDDHNNNNNNDQASPFGIRHSAFGIQHPASSIQHPPSAIHVPRLPTGANRVALVSLMSGSGRRCQRKQIRGEQNAKLVQWPAKLEGPRSWAGERAAATRWRARWWPLTVLRNGRRHRRLWAPRAR